MKLPQFNWFKYLYCYHEFASDALQISKICVHCGWHNAGWAHPHFIHRMLAKIDKRGRIIGDIVHLKERI